MTTIVLTHPSENCRKFQIFVVYNAPAVHHVFGLVEVATPRRPTSMHMR